MKLKTTVIFAAFAMMLFSAPASSFAQNIANHGAFFGSYPFQSSRVFQSAGFSYASAKLRDLQKKKVNEEKWVNQSKNKLVAQAFSLAEKNTKKYRANGYALDNISFQVVRGSKNISLYMDYNLIVLK